MCVPAHDRHTALAHERGAKWKEAYALRSAKRKVAEK